MISMERFEAISNDIISKLFDGFSDEDLAYLSLVLKPTTRTYLKGETVLHEGEEVCLVGVVVTGKISGLKFQLEGGAHLLRSFCSGDVLFAETIFSTFHTAHMTYIADEETTLLFFSEYFMKENNSTSFQNKLLLNMIQILADDNIKLAYKTEVLSKRSLRQRILTFLSIMAEKRGTDRFRIRMNQEQFAQYLCVNRSALCYELNQMKRDGILAFRKDEYQILKKPNKMTIPVE